jgi:UDPglucose 6-dehydrogenase
MTALQRISVFGLGKLGACIAATLASRGFDVLGVDIDPEKVRRLNEGLPPVEEPLLADTIAAGRARLRATLTVADAVETDVSFFIPPSPSLPDGSFSNEYLLRAMQPLAKCLRDAGKKHHLFVVSSTTTPGTVREVLIPVLEQQTGWKCPQDFSVCYNPEFIALGNVVRGLLEPDLVLIGESDPASGALLEELYKRYTRNKPTIARMSITSAELTKICINSYITTKISFTNQIRLIAERFPDANAHDILAAVGSDTRIGSKYLRPGLSYGGPCFPRDNRLLAYTARQVGLEAPVAVAADRMNELTKEQLLETVRALVSPGDAVAILGMAYKPETYIVEESAGLYLAQKLKRLGHRVLVHDFIANPSNSPALIEFEVIADLADLPKREDIRAVAICCPSPGYAGLRVPAKARLFDPWGMGPGR